MKKVRGKIILDIETEYDDNESTADTMLYCVLEDLNDTGLYAIHRESVEEYEQLGSCTECGEPVYEVDGYIKVCGSYAHPKCAENKEER